MYGGDGMTNMNRELNADLARIFAFDAVDLAANRAGHLSPDQQVMFHNAARQGGGRALLVLALVLLVGCAAAAVVATGGQPAGFGIAAGLLVAPTIAIALLNRSQRRRVAAMSDPVLRSVEGEVSIGMTMPSGFRIMHCGPVQFEIQSADAQYIRHGHRHRIHYVEGGTRAQTVLTIEKLD